MQFSKSVLPFVIGCCVLPAGTLFGFWVGQTDLRTLLPSLFTIGTVVSFTAAVCFAIYRPCFKQSSARDTAFLVLCLFIFAAALGSSASATADWQLYRDRIVGFMPYSDASNYYQQVLEWPAQTFNAWNSRRPLNATVNILEFHLGGSTLLGMILVRIALAALAIVAFIIALTQVAGRAAALTSGFILTIWTWPYASSILSEINGITISAAGYALLLVALAQRRQTYAYLGLFSMVIAYAFRPYNPLMPALFTIVVMLELTTDWRKGLKAILLASVAFTILAVALPKVVYLAYGHPDGGPNTNTGNVVLGLARGTNWKEASDFVESKAPGLSEKEKNALMYEMAIESAKIDAGPLISALTAGLIAAVSEFRQELGKTMGVSNPAISYLFSFVCVVLIFFTRKRCRPVALLGGVSVVTFFTIAPVVFSDGGWRVAATLYPGLALLVTIIPASIRYGQSSGVTTTARSAQIRKIVSESRWISFIPMGVVGFVLIAMLYPAVSRLYLNDGNPLLDAFTLDVRNEETPRWTGLNRAVITQRELLAWAIKERPVGLAAFLEQYGNSVQQVRFENGGYVLLCKSTPGMPDVRGSVGDPLFQLRFM